MTILVYRDNVLASDSQLISRQWAVIGTMEKIARIEVFHPSVLGSDRPDVYLVGATGEAAYAQKFMKWCKSEDFTKFILNQEHTSPQIEPAGKDEVCTGFVIKPDHGCIRFEGNSPPYEVRGDWYAFGSGDLIAIGALAAKASAEEAVRITIRYDIPSEGPIQVLRR